MYNLIYKGVKINKQPLSLAQAHAEVSSIIINSGYAPEIIDENTIEVGDTFQSTINYRIYTAIKINRTTINAIYEGCPFRYVQIRKSTCTLLRKAQK
jgi:hypothetical protein